MMIFLHFYEKVIGFLRAKIFKYHLNKSNLFHLNKYIKISVNIYKTINIMQYIHYTV